MGFFEKVRQALSLPALAAGGPRPVAVVPPDRDGRCIGATVWDSF